MPDHVTPVDPRSITGGTVTAPAVPLVAIKLHWRVGNVNAGEVAGFPPEEAARLCAMEHPKGLGKVAELYTPEPKKK